MEVGVVPLHLALEGLHGLLMLLALFVRLVLSLALERLVAGHTFKHLFFDFRLFVFLLFVGFPHLCPLRDCVLRLGRVHGS